MNGRYCHLSPKNGLCQCQFNFSLDVKFVDSLVKVVLLDLDVEEQVPRVRRVDIRSMPHVLYLDLVVIFDAAWQLNLLRQNLPLDAYALACRAENFWDTACSFALRAPLFNIVVANDATSATTLEALARFGAYCSSLTFALMADDSFI